MNFKKRVWILAAVPAVFVVLLSILGIMLRPQDEILRSDVSFQKFAFLNVANTVPPDKTINSKEFPEQNDYPQSDDLEKSAAIVCARPTGKRITPKYSLITQAEVTESYRGGLSKGDIIYIVDWVWYMDEWRQQSVDGYLPMWDNEEYLLFLEPYAYDVTMPEFMKKSFVVNWSVYGKYTAGNHDGEYLADSGFVLENYEENPLEAVFFSEEAYDRYLKLKEYFCNQYQ